MRKVFILILVLFYLFNFTAYSVWSIAAVTLWAYYAIQLFEKVNHTIAFREFVMVLWGMNYLLSPALTYERNDELLAYGMKIPVERYFSLAIPAMLALQAGLYLLKPKIFSPDFSQGASSFLNEKVLRQWIIGGTLISLVEGSMPSELAFFAYLLGGVRFVAAFGLMALNKRKYWWWVLIVFSLELGKAFRAGMFHDALLWLVFFGIFWIYITKPSFLKKLSVAAVALAGFFILQVSKSDYRELTWSGRAESGIGTFIDVAMSSSDKGLLDQQNVSNSISRVNQAWIFASTVNRMDATQDFQELYLVGLYAKSAILPRFLAPDKLTAGNQLIFNTFSGHWLNEGTAMALGVFADGYIAYADWGVWIFAFVFGFMIAMVFKIIEGWSDVSPYFVLFMFPILNYAVRPDCESQTIIGQMVKGVVVFAILVMYYRKYYLRRPQLRANSLVANV